MVKIGIIGSINSAVSYLPVINSITSLEFTGLFDPNVNISQNSRSSGLNLHASAESLIGNSEIVCISDNNISFDFISLAIKKARNIILPCPFILKHKEADDLLKIAGEAGVKVQINLSDYYFNIFSKASEIVNNPIYIDINYSDNSDVGKFSSIIYDKLMYDILLVISLVNCDIRRVISLNAPVFSHRPELVNIRIEFNNGCVASFITDLVSGKTSHWYDFFQNESILKFDLKARKIKIAESINKLNKESSKIENPQVEDSNKTLEYKTISIDEDKTLKDEILAFLNCLKEDTQPKISLENYLTSCQVIQSITDKTENN